MKIARDNLDKILFENYNIKLSIADVMTHASASPYYYHDIEITVQKALGIRHKAWAADGEEGGFYSMSFLGFLRESVPLSSGLQHAFTQQYSQRRCS